MSFIMNLSHTDLEVLLKQHFGRDELDPDQEEIITSILSGRDVLAVTNGRFDQSVCYKLPALVLDGLTLVVSRSRRTVEAESIDLLPSVHINSSLHTGHLQNWIWSIAQGKYKLVYAGPEQFRNRAFLLALTKIPVSLLVIQDAHCISRWGHDFRPDYLDISKAIMEMNNQPRIMALAGACTQRTRDDIRYQLQIDDAKTVLTDLARPDLSLEVVSALSTEDKYDTLGSLVRKLRGSGIIYTNSRRQTMEICEFLKEFESKVAAYHAGLERKRRIQIERAFAEGQLHTIVATNAFRATLNKPDIKYIIYFDMPDRLERYYQQISSAGGDGESARCVLIYSPSDRDFHRRSIEMNAMPLAEVWRISDVLNRHAKDEPVVPSIGSIERWEQMSFNRALNKWLREHFLSLPPEKQKELSGLKDSYEELDGWDKNPYTSDKYDKYLEAGHWREFSKLMRAEHEQCQICGRESRYVHHLHYRTLTKEQPEDVAALCTRCHCYIHPYSPMARKIFEEIRESEKNQPKLLDAPKLNIGPLVVFPYGQMELEAAVDRYKLHAILREMEVAGAVSILPDCSIQAQVNILVPRDELKTYAEDETGQLIAKWLLENSESDPQGEIYVDLVTLKNELSCQHDVLEDSLLALHYAEAISYRPSRRGMALRLIDTDFSPTEDAFERLKESRYQALRAMEEYVNTRECRQRFLCNHLGYDIGENCGKCDNCMNAADVDTIGERSAVPHYARAALELVNRSEGRLDKNALVRILAGGKQRTTRFDKWKEYGVLSMFTPEDILRMLDFLIGHGFLKEESGSRPPVSLTGRGFRALEGEFEIDDEKSIASLAEDMKRIAQSTKPQGAISAESTEANSEQDQVLITILRCAGKTDGQVGRSGLMKLLRGQKSKKLAKYGFDHMEEYGSLSDMPKKVVLENIDSMLERGCLAVTSFFFPMLRLTELGQKRLERIKQV